MTCKTDIHNTLHTLFLLTKSMQLDCSWPVAWIGQYVTYFPYWGLPDNFTLDGANAMQFILWRLTAGVEVYVTACGQMCPWRINSKRFF